MARIGSGQIGSRRLAFAASLIAALLLAPASPAEAAPPERFQLEDIGDEGSSGAGRSGGPFGAGILLGEPTALTAKLFLSSESALQFHLGYAFGRKDKLVFIVDYLFHIHGVIPPIQRAGRLAPYVGGGGRLGIHDDDPLLGLRIPLGLSFMLASVPLEIFVEVAPGIGLVPETELIVDGGLGARFYF